MHTLESKLPINKPHLQVRSRDRREDETKHVFPRQFQRDYKLLLDNKYSVPPECGKPSTEFAGPSRWRIEEAPPEQWVSVATAINYGTQMRNASRDPSIRENADKTLAILRGLR